MNRYQLPIIPSLARCTANGIKAIAAKDNITAIKIKSGRMLQAHGFLRRVFEIFEVYETSIDMITTSEVAVSVLVNFLVLVPVVVLAIYLYLYYR